MEKGKKKGEEAIGDKVEAKKRIPICELPMQTIQSVFDLLLGKKDAYFEILIQLKFIDKQKEKMLRSIISTAEKFLGKNKPQIDNSVN